MVFLYFLLLFCIVLFKLKKWNAAQTPLGDVKKIFCGYDILAENFYHSTSVSSTK